MLASWLCLSVGHAWPRQEGYSDRFMSDPRLTWEGQGVHMQLRRSKCQEQASQAATGEALSPLSADRPFLRVIFDF